MRKKRQRKYDHKTNKQTDEPKIKIDSNANEVSGVLVPSRKQFLLLISYYFIIH